MKLILLKHGRRNPADRDLDDPAQGVDPAELPRIAAVREWLLVERLAPRQILTSHHRHARETAEVVRCPRTRSIVAVTGLTPGTDEQQFSLEAILVEAAQKGVSWAHAEILMLVGHETRLSQLAECLTGVPRPRLLHHLESMVIDVQVSVQCLFEPQPEVTT
jgi:phosphohistidine phosphatase SixA